MKDYLSAGGERRLWFDDDEIEHIVEDELRKAGLAPTQVEPVTDLERFVESHLQCPLDQYSDLPIDVLGMTEFRRGRRPSISINRNLTGSALDEDESAPGVLGRWRATLAHEACHVLLHRVLFEFDEHQGELFASAAASGPSLMRCLKRDVAYAGFQADWREVQANKGMATMLMPARTFKRVVRAELGVLGLSTAGLAAGSSAAATLATAIAQRLSVSRQAAAIRLETLGFVARPGATHLDSL